MKYRPLNDWVLIELDEDKNRTKSGLHLPPSAQQSRFVIGTIIECGPYVQDPFLQPSRRVALDKHSLIDVYLNDEIFHIERAKSILGIVEEESK